MKMIEKLGDFKTFAREFWTLERKILCPNYKKNKDGSHSMGPCDNPQRVLELCDLLDALNEITGRKNVRTKSISSRR